MSMLQMVLVAVGAVLVCGAAALAVWTLEDE
jgi:hypothetical protein